MVSRGPIHTSDSSRKGDYWEAYVELEAWKRGAEVYPNKGCTGKVDMILLIDNQPVLVDVKVMKYNPRDKTWQSPRAASKDVYLVLVNPETDTIRWSYKNGTQSPNCPTDLENFWS